jgi:hypothetical protein
MMKSLHSALILTSGLALLLGLLPLNARAQEAPEPTLSRNEFLRGTHVFRRVLADVGMEPLASFDELDKVPEQSILIVLGRTECLRELPGGLDRFLQRGGALLLASDQRIDDRQISAQLQWIAGVVIAGDLIVCRERLATYQQAPHCPFLVPPPRAEPALLRNPRDESTRLRVATNLPSCLLSDRRLINKRRLTELAYLPSQCYVERGGMPVGPWPLFAVGGDVGQGRVLVLADHSLFINQMMLPMDNNNVEFTCNCVTWLAGASRQRNKVLLVENGAIQTRFDIPLQKVPIPAEELTQALLAVGERLVVERNRLTRDLEQSVMEYEEDDGFNRASSSLLDSMGLTSRTLGRVLLVLLTLAGVLYALYRIGVRGRRNLDTAIPLLAQAAGEQVPTRAVLDRRHREMMRAGNLLEPLQQIARAWFDEAGGAGHAQAPRVRVAGGWWRRWRVAHRVRWFWSLARGRALRVDSVRLARWLGELERLRTAHRAGTLELIWEARSR